MVPMRRHLQTSFLWVWFAGLGLAATSIAPAAEFDVEGWRVVTPEELAMKSEPRAPGAAAVYLYTQIDRDDEGPVTKVHKQVKILTEEGRDRANIEIRYDKSGDSVSDIEARVVQSDGAIVPFKGTIYDRPIASGRDVKMQAKTFTLPDVRVGSTIEYRYVYRRRFNLLYDSNWVLSQELFTRFARYSITVHNYGNARWSYPNGLPEGAGLPVVKGRNVRLETRNVPAFVTEQYMPPSNELRFLVEFYYVGDDSMQSDPVKYWNALGKRVYRSQNRFANDSGAVRKALAGIVAPGDSATQKARKIYDHVQRLRNTSYEPELDPQEAKRRRDIDASSAADVARHGYGDSLELMAYFLALVRAAGIPAEPVLVGGRANRFFKKTILNAEQLDSSVVAVTLDGKDVLLDPSIPFLPFGALLWSDTAVQGLKLNEDGGTWISMPLPDSEEAVTSRKAKFTLNEDGELQGTVSITYTGREALWRRLQQRNEDEQSRREFLEEDIKEQLAGQAQVKVVRQPEWSGTGPLQTEYQVKLADWVVISGNRLLVGMGIFGGHEKGVFVAAKRVHPIYFAYPFKTEDELRIVLPAGYRQQGAPETWPAAKEGNTLAYSISADSNDGALVIRRDITVSTLFSSRDSYGKFRDFYESVRAGDEHKVVLEH
jgi:hypothetical protein